MFSSRCLAHSSIVLLYLTASNFAYDVSSNTNIAMYYVGKSKALVFLALGATMLTSHQRVKDQEKMSSDSVIFVTVRPSTLYRWDL